MAPFNHPNVMKLVGMVRASDELPAFLVVDLCTKGSLLKLLRDMDSAGFPGGHLHELWKYCNDIAWGMGHLADQKCVHRDLATRNVLVDHSNRAKISE